ncbi:MAG: hypothetical protein ACJA0Q_000601 [Saprospiraceae bacterium]|jgi:hypothetical protein
MKAIKLVCILSLGLSFSCGPKCKDCHVVLTNLDGTMERSEIGGCAMKN